ncbi:hypothetical protein Cri9333_0562 [Crinalium epipsammum PCC 9333]|uniref:Uncharacterized protein n=2 Tax=Crinalium TaxID=241421 RepID=K9VVI6_9CYAN|nr:hypothetical protein Cri9333_0562 [Crinalium epipsammum PCC 9333]
MQLQTRSTNQNKIRIPRVMLGFLQREIQFQPDNKKLSLVMFEPMELEDWCQFWIPIIHPDIPAPTQSDTRRPRGYMAACKTTIAALTQSSESSVENWIYGDRECPHVVKMYLRAIHLLWLMRRQFRFPINFPDC